VLIDNYDISKGWKALNGSRNNDAMGMKESPKSVGVKDGGVLAFRFRGEDEGVENDEEVDGETEEFVVEWPSYDETYGEEAEPQDDNAEMDEKKDRRYGVGDIMGEGRAGV
jgi:hypothetical protein